MEISDEAIKEFKEIYKKEFKEDIDDRQARIMAGRLLNLYKAVYEPSHKNEESIQI
ncbi:MAG: hypothetical protein ABSA74_00205 [Candidatus Staskawiczbacteria bacterium]|jgi:hypothetical protein